MKAGNRCLALRIVLVLLAPAVVGIVASLALRAAELPIVKGEVILERHRTDSAAKLSELPSTKLGGSDVAHQLQGSPAVGAVDQGADRSARQARRDASTVGVEQ
jgi:hypothetical protein